MAAGGQRVGAVLTGVVLLIVVYEKFADGAYLVVILVPLLVGMMRFIHRQYAALRGASWPCARPRRSPPPRREERVGRPVPGLNRAVIHAVNVAARSTDVRAVLISEEPERPRVRAAVASGSRPASRWSSSRSPYRALVGPLARLPRRARPRLAAGQAAPITFVVIPEYVARSWWERMLYNQSAKRLRDPLLGRPHTVVVNVPYRRDPT